MQKSYKVGYYQPYGVDRDHVAQAFSDAADVEIGEHIELGSHGYQLKNVKRVNRWIEGEFCKYRYDDLPSIANPDSNDETDIELADEEGLVEKNYFRFLTERNLMMFQHFREASTITRFSEFVGALVGDAMTFAPLIREEDIIDLAAGGIKTKRLELSIGPARGRALNADNPELSSISRSIIETLSGSEGRSLYLRIGMGRGNKHEYLSNGMKTVWEELIASDDVEVTAARVRVTDEDDDAHEVDLLMDRISSSVTVEKFNRYPARGEMLRAMREDYRERQYEIDQVLE